MQLSSSINGSGLKLLSHALKLLNRLSCKLVGIFIGIFCLGGFGIFIGDLNGNGPSLQSRKMLFPFILFLDLDVILCSLSNFSNCIHSISVLFFY